MNFDKVAYCSRENTLASECIAFFIEWNGILEGKAKLCYDYFQKNYQGTYEIPSYTAVSKALKQKVGTGGSAHMESYDDFASKLNALMDKFTPVEKRKMAQTSAFLPNMLALR